MNKSEKPWESNIHTQYNLTNNKENERNYLFRV